MYAVQSFSTLILIVMGIPTPSLYLAFTSSMEREREREARTVDWRENDHLSQYVNSVHILFVLPTTIIKIRFDT